MPGKQRSSRIPAHAPGLGVDAAGGPVVDPTENVIALTKAESARQDDLRKAERRFVMAHLRHVEKFARLRADHQSKQAKAESERIDSIRQTDLQATATTNATAQTAIQTLENRRQTDAETLRTLVNTTAASLATANNTGAAEINKRISAVELALSEGKGKSQVVEPRNDKLTEAVEALVRAQAASLGKSEGFKASGGLIVVGIGLLFTVLSIAGIVITLVLAFNRGPAAPAYVPAPTGTTLPTAPPLTPNR
jgi:hypothetical protein